MLLIFYHSGANCQRLCPVGLFASIPLPPSPPHTYTHTQTHTHDQLKHIETLPGLCRFISLCYFPINSTTRPFSLTQYPKRIEKTLSRPPRPPAKPCYPWIFVAMGSWERVAASAFGSSIASRLRCSKPVQKSKTCHLRLCSWYSTRKHVLEYRILNRDRSFVCFEKYRSLILHSIRYTSRCRENSTVEDWNLFSIEQFCIYCQTSSN